MDVTVSRSKSADGAAVDSRSAVALSRRDGAAEGTYVPAVRNGLELEQITEMPRAPAMTPCQAIETSHPPAFDKDFMRWLPFVLPLIGVALVLLTGLMWKVAS